MHRLPATRPAERVVCCVDEGRPPAIRAAASARRAGRRAAVPHRRRFVAGAVRLGRCGRRVSARWVGTLPLLPDPARGRGSRSGTGVRFRAQAAGHQRAARRSARRHHPVVAQFVGYRLARVQLHRRPRLGHRARRVLLRFHAVPVRGGVRLRPVPLHQRGRCGGRAGERHGGGDVAGVRRAVAKPGQTAAGRAGERRRRGVADRL